MKFRLTTASMLLLLSLSVSAQFQTLQLAHEVPGTFFTVPVTQNGTLNFRSCDNCEQFSARLTPQTRFIVDSQPVQLKEFRAAVLGVRDRESYIVTILQHLDSNTITSISFER